MPPSEDLSDLFESDDELELSCLWRRSESPVESFSDAEGANEDGNWGVQIVGEEVDSAGEIRYEARWENWTRADGTNVTWDNNLLHPDDILGWKKQQTTRRKSLACESLDIEIWGTLDIHNTPTRLRAQAYDEKLQKRKSNPLKHAQKMAKLLADKLPHTYGDPSAAAGPSTPGPSLRPRRQATDSSSVQSASGSVASSSRSSTTLSSASYRTPTSSVTSMSVSAPASAASSSKGKGKAAPRLAPPRTPSPAESTTRRQMKNLPTRARKAPTPKVTRREKLEREWNNAARSSEAASITLTNNVDDEEIPHLEPDFHYIETGYIYSKEIQQQDDTELFVHCDCDECSYPSACDCQGPSELVEENGPRIFAYTEDRLFAFNVPSGVEVIECNIFCRCDVRSCPNRVAQLPRDVPVDIFKTTNRGWGVRAPVDVEQGKVLGIYTGLLIPRHAALKLSGDIGSYCFDLDGREDRGAETPEDAYSVDSRTCGNWTRFINHSCAPNLRVYLVVYDTIPERNIPYLAFVALEDIQAGTEFTFDYDPGVAGKQTKAKGKGKGKGKFTIPLGAKPCFCGASGQCRGWVRV